MQLVRLPTRGRLRRYVTEIWAAEGVPPAGFVKRFHPSGEVDLVVHREDPCRVRSSNADLRPTDCVVATGLALEPVVVEPSSALCLVSARLTPSGAAHLFDCPVSEMVDRIFRVDDLQPALSRRLHGLHDEAGGDLHGLVVATQRLLEQRFEGRLVSRLDHALDRIRSARGAVTVDRLTHDVGVHRRYLERLFARELGLSPKRYAQMVRFGAAIDLCRQAPQPRWADIAAHTGYADQSQLTRDFRRRTGMTPAALHRLERATQRVAEIG